MTVIRDMRIRVGRMRMGGMVTRSHLRSDSNKLPPGWRILQARGPGNQEVKSFYLSPEGKRFQTRKEMMAFIHASREPFEDAIIGSPSKIVRKMLEEQKKKSGFTYIFKDNRLVMSEKIRQRRTQMKMKNPFRNLRNTVLRKNLLRAQKEEKRRKFMDIRTMFQSRKRTVKRAISSVVKSKGSNSKNERRAKRMRREG